MELAIFKDCEAIIDSFTANENPRFESFVYQWKAALFQTIYSSQSQTVEIIQSTKVCIHGAKRILASKNTMHKLGALYLLYAIHFKQPTARFQKIDFDLTAWRQLKEFVFSLENSMYGDDAKYIFWQLLKEDSIRFVASDIYFGLENLVNLDKIRNNVNLSTSIHMFRSDIRRLSSPKGLFAGITKLDDGYSEMKEFMNQDNLGNKERYVMPISKEFENLKNAFSRLHSLIDESYSPLVGKRKKKKDRVNKTQKGVVKLRRRATTYHFP